MRRIQPVFLRGSGGVAAVIPPKDGGTCPAGRAFLSLWNRTERNQGGGLSMVPLPGPSSLTTRPGGLRAPFWIYPRDGGRGLYVGPGVGRELQVLVLWSSYGPARGAMGIASPPGPLPLRSQDRERPVRPMSAPGRSVGVGAPRSSRPTLFSVGAAYMPPVPRPTRARADTEVGPYGGQCTSLRRGGPPRPPASPVLAPLLRGAGPA